MRMMKGDIFRLINIYIIEAGSILIKSKIDRSILGQLGPGAILCCESFMKTNDPWY